MLRSTLVAFAVLAVMSATASAHETRAPTKTELQGPAHQAGAARNMELVGHNDLGGRGYNADVWVHEGHAYVGSWGFSDWNDGGEQRFCPNDGVAVIDTSAPTNPAWDGTTLESPTGTSAEDVVVFTAAHGPLAGRDIAVVGIQVCGGSRYDTGIFRGLQIFDVTDPADPTEIGLLNTGCCTRGLHELEVQHREDLGRTFVYASVPTSEYPDSLSPSGRRDEAGRGDFRLIDVTNPGAPVEVSNWGVLHDPVQGLPAPGLGCDPDPIYGHSAEPSADGKLAFVSYWDSGFIALDLSNPATPRFLGRTVYPPSADGDGHSSNFDEARGLLFAADEDFCKTSGSGTEKGFGYLRVYDYNNLAAPTQIGEFRTPNSAGTKDVGAGDYTIHNPLLVGTDVYISWYSDGVRVVDASVPSLPREVAFFVPPSAKNPVQPSQRGTLTNATQVWGVAYEEATGLVYASDMNSGLWILRRTN
jgi:hypothetical protein